MTTVFQNETIAPDFGRYRAQWENALLSLALFEAAGGTESDRRALSRQWMLGLFNGHAAGVPESPEDGFRSLEWVAAGSTQFDLIYTATGEMKCSLGRVYQQPGGSWAALVIAGVKDDLYDAMASAEWAVSRLSC